MNAVSETLMKKVIIKKNSVILNRATDYYENDNERLREQTKYN